MTETVVKKTNWGEPIEFTNENGDLLEVFSMHSLSGKLLYCARFNGCLNTRKQYPALNRKVQQLKKKYNLKPKKIDK